MGWSRPCFWMKEGGGGNRGEKLRPPLPLALRNLLTNHFEPGLPRVSSGLPDHLGIPPLTGVSGTNQRLDVVCRQFGSVDGGCSGLGHAQSFRIRVMLRAA